jgi:septal ring factor EnvC (AmiA/AmiB activator)
MEASAMAVELREHDRRLSGLHRTVGAIGTTVGDHTTKISVVTTELRETREDIADMKKDLAAARSEQKEEMTWVRRGLWLAAGTFMMFFVAAATLLVQVAGN